MNNYKVYMHVNKINDKKYIGMTSMIPIYRWGNGRYYGHNAHFSSAIKQYGWKNFEHYIIDYNLSKEEACELEKDLIERLKTTDRNFGYNILNGGDVSSAKHGCSTTRIYNVFQKALHKYDNFPWKTFEEFREWAMATGYEDDKVIYLEDGEYKWCKRYSKLGNLYTLYGKTKSFSAWCREYDITRASVMQRMKKGWSFEKALTTPVKKRNKRGI